MSDRWYWVVDCDNTVADPYVSGAEELCGFDEDHLWDGREIAQWNPAAWIAPSSPEDDGNLDDVLQNHLGLPIYSPALQAALTLADVRGLQYCPLRVLHFDGTEVTGFAIANILNVVNALDLQRSDYVVFPDDDFIPERRGKVVGIRTAVLKRERLRGYHIVRLTEPMAPIYVSELFKQTFDKHGFTGYSFHEVEVVTGA